MRKGTLTLSRSKYACSLLKHFGMENCGGSQVPLSSTTSYGKEHCPETDEDKEIMENVPYRQAIGSLMYLMVSTRPDLAYAIQILSRFGANPGPVHWKGVKKVLQYISHTLNYGLVYQRTQEKLTGFCDADFSSCVDTSRSNGGFEG